ncbi:rhomboid family intramembrane serine protease [Hominifimenecus sp. rT4P-3]|uniref:rhomboid family intramembrane serine protease n=1 Tax=Hominifimenecus sp. rT4P-3 TaxID=3242979 RepID=UPI003DA3C1B4
MDIRYDWHRRPVVTIFLIGLNAIFFFGPDLFGIPTDLRSILNGGGITLSGIEEGEFYRALTAAFLHFDIHHLMGNLLILAVLGYRLEDILGHLSYLILYLISAVGANVVSVLVYFHTNNYGVISAGASGAIFGVCGGMFAVALLGRTAEGISVQQIFLLIILTLASGYLSMEVNNIAHLSGLIFGIFLGFLFYLIRRHSKNNSYNSWQ